MTHTSRRQVLLAPAAIAVAAAIGRRARAAERATVTARTAMDIGNLDPGNRVGTTEDNVIMAACQTLVRYDPDATQWTLDAAKSVTRVSDTQFDFELNPGQMFSGGYGEMTADDVKFSFDRYINGDRNGKKLTYADDLGALERVEVTGKYTGRLWLKHPSPGLWQIGIGDSSGAILSRKASDALGERIATELVGSGAYVLAEWRPKERFVLTASPGYAGARKPHFPKIVTRLIPETRTSILAFQAGEVDFTDFDPDTKPMVAGIADAALIERPGIDYTWIGLNVERGALADVRVRQAIRLGIDVEAIIAGAYSGGVSRARSLLAPALLGYWADAPTYDRDVGRAKALLAEAGQSTLSLTFTCLNDSVSLATAQIVQANLAELGVTVTIAALDPGAYWAMGADDKSKNLDLTLIPYTSKVDPGFQTQWFVSSQVGLWNWQRWRSAEFDRLHAEGGATMDPARRTVIYTAMQKLLDESASCVWITHGSAFYLRRKWLMPALMANAKNWRYDLFSES